MAEEITRLRALNADLLAALKNRTHAACLRECAQGTRGRNHSAACLAARAALARASGGDA